MKKRKRKNEKDTKEKDKMIKRTGKRKRIKK